MSQLSRLLRSQHHSLAAAAAAPVRYIEGQQPKQLCLSVEEAQLSTVANTHSSNSAATQTISKILSQQQNCFRPVATGFYPTIFEQCTPPTSNSSSSTVLCSLMDLLSVQDTAIRLPTAVPVSPIDIPPSLPIYPKELPEHETAVASIVEPYDDLLPRLLPNTDIQSNITMECVNMLRVRKLKMKKHRKKKEFKRNFISIQKNKMLRQIQFEKAFMNEQLALLQGAESFNAADYVQQKLDKKNNRPVPKFYQGKRLPEVCVMEMMMEKGQVIPGTEDDCDYSYNK